MIGLINIQWFDNPGAVWLAYSLQQTVRKLKPDEEVVIIDYAAGGSKTIDLSPANKVIKRIKRKVSNALFYLDVKNKAEFLQTFMSQRKLEKQEVVYIGDDLNDLSSMMLAGYIGCPADSCPEIKKIANYISSVKGGNGAVRDVIEHILHESGQWDNAVSRVYGIGI